MQALRGVHTLYTTRMYSMHRAYMDFRLVKLIEGPDTMDYVLRLNEVLAKARKKPEWGDTERMMGEVADFAALCWRG